MRMVTEQPIRVEEHVVGGQDPRYGAVVTFCGVVRSNNAGRTVTGILYECYREMAEAEMERIVEDVARECGVGSLRIVHRIGELKAGEVSLLVVASAEHRRKAFDATRRAVEEIKRRVPIWKKERYADARAEWR
jgi:molybdopterin synthase catalytic subunit